MRASKWGLVTALVLSSSAAIADSEFPVTVSPAVGYLDFDHDRNLDDRAVKGLGVAYDVNDDLSLGVWLGRVHTRNQTTKVPFGVDVVGLRANYGMMMVGKSHPYLTAGIGVFRSPGQPEMERNNSVFDVGAGVSYPITSSHQTALFVEYRHGFAGGSNSRYQDDMVLGGLKFGFAGPKRKGCRHSQGLSDSVEKVMSFFDRTPSTETVPFGFDSDALSSANFENLKEIAAYLKAHPKKSLQIEGHSDAKGHAPYNSKLSFRRANAVAEYLQTEYGIEATQLRVVGRGIDQPVANNEEESGRALNRRAELKFVEDNS